VPRPPSFTPFERAGIEQSIPARFARIAAGAPHRPAVLPGATYGELAAASTRLARAIRAATGTTPEPVALLLGTGMELVTAILAVLEAGHFYVPLDAAHPEPALRALLEDSGARVIVTDSAGLALAERLTGRPPIDVAAPQATRGGDTAGRAPGPDDLACIYYTSGTTGRPKGVVDTHRNVLHNVMRYTHALHLSPEDRLTLLQAPAFSGAMSSLFGALLNGGTSCPYDVARDGVAGIGPWLRERRVTVHHSVPAIFRHFLRADGGTFPDVRVVRLEGDRAAPADLDRFRRHFGPGAVLSHGLGATECGLVCRFVLGRDEPFEGAVVPIGHPVEDMAVRILDDEGRELPAGEPGEIVVESRYLSPGYWRRPDLTARVFGEGREPGVRSYRTGDVGRVRPDGAIEHLGRRDLQPKVRGQRVDAEAIEAALTASGLVADAVAAVRAGTAGEGTIVAYVVPRGPGRPTASALRRTLARTLPAHLIPARFVPLAALPLTAHGKVDRPRLPDPDRGRPDLDEPYVAPGSQTESKLAAVWRETLALDVVGVHDDFFELGGDSLAAMVALERTREECGVELAPQALFESPTIAGLAAAVEAARGRPGAAGNTRPALVAVRAGGRRPPFLFLHAEYGGDGFYCLDVARHLGDDQPFLALPPHGRDGGPVPETIEAMAEAHARVLAEAGARGPYRLGGFCSAAVVAWELARRLTAAGRHAHGASPRRAGGARGGGRDPAAGSAAAGGVRGACDRAAETDAPRARGGGRRAGPGRRRGGTACAHRGRLRAGGAIVPAAAVRRPRVVPAGAGRRRSRECRVVAAPGGGLHRPRHPRRPRLVHPGARAVPGRGAGRGAGLRGRGVCRLRRPPARSLKRPGAGGRDRRQ
jgi:amino acid adenylation domain-containing protein